MTKVILLPGEYHISKRPGVIETLVGSCVSVCLYNIKTNRAAMNHFLLDRATSESDHETGKYGDTATEYIINALMRTDPAARHYRAQIFGGANVIKTSNSKPNIGEKNIAVAREILAAHNIAIIREEIGGSTGRRVWFDTAKNSITYRFAGQIGKKIKK